jgi:hypothetical protein
LILLASIPNGLAKGGADVGCVIGGTVVNYYDLESQDALGKDRFDSSLKKLGTIVRRDDD